jgi:nucleoside-diphosphate-sugar epimerase
LENKKIKMKILVTGGAGYKGILLSERLLNLGYEVTILDNFMYGYESVLHLLSNKKLDIIKLDIRNITETITKKYDVIFHLAGISGMPACAANPHSAEHINVEATKKLVNLLSDEQIIINASTTSLYGNFNGVADENSDIIPVSLYGKTKWIAEKIVQEKNNSISLRFATVFGLSPKMRNDLLVNDFVYKSVVDRSIIIFAGHSKRTFIHMKDVIDSYIFSLDNFNIMKNDVYNVGDEKLNFSKIDIAKAIKEYVNFELIDSSLPDLDNRDFTISFEKIKKLGYQTKVDLDYGIKELSKLYSFYRYNLPYNII